MAAVEKLGVEFFAKIATSFTQNFTYVAGSFMRLSSQVDKVQQKLVNYGKTEEATAYRGMQYWTKYSNSVAKDINRVETAIAAGEQQFQDFIATLRGGIPVTDAEIEMFDKFRDALGMMGDELQAKQSDWLAAQLNVKGYSEALDKAGQSTQEALAKMKNPFSAFFSMLTGGWAENIIDTTTFGGVLAKIVPSLVTLSTILNVAKLAFDAMRFAVRFAMAVFNTLWGIVVKVGTALWNIAKTIGGYVINSIVTLGRNITTWLVEKFKEFIALPFNIAQNALSGLVNMFKQIFAVTAGVGLDRILQSVGQAIKTVASTAFQAAVDFQSLEIRLTGLLQREIAGGITTKEISYANIVPSEAQLKALDDLNFKLTVAQQRLQVAEGNYNKSGTLAHLISVETNQKTVDKLTAQVDSLQASLTGTYKVLTQVTTGTMSFADALPLAQAEVVKLTDWFTNWALKTKFDAETISNAFALAMSYGLTSAESQQMIISITQYATGMGLAGDEFTHIIENFGQMMMAGKLTGTELRDLARGAFLPINRLIEIMGDNLGLTSDQVGTLKKQLQDMTASGEISVGEFFKAFYQMVAKDFPDAVKNMSVTWAVMQSNLKEDFVKTILGWKVMLPLVDALAKKMSPLVNALTSPEMQKRWGKFGENLAYIVTNFMDWVDSFTGGGSSKIITWFGSFLDSINEFVSTLENLPYIVTTWGQGRAIQMLLAALGISDVGGGKLAAIDAFVNTLLDQGLWPAISQWFTNTLVPDIKSLIETYGPGVIASLTTTVTDGLQKVADWFGAQLGADSPFVLFLNLIKSIMTYLGAKATEAIPGQYPSERPGGEMPYDLGATTSASAMADVQKNWETFKTTLIGIANDGIGLINTKFLEFYNDITPKIDTWLTTIQTPWGNLKTIFEGIYKFLSDIVIGLTKVDFKTLGADLVILATPLVAISKALLGIPSYDGRLDNWGIGFNKLVSDTMPNLLLFENVISGIVMGFKGLALARAYMTSPSKENLGNMLDFFTKDLPSVADKFQEQWDKLKEQANTAGADVGTQFTTGLMGSLTAILTSPAVNSPWLMTGQTQIPTGLIPNALYQSGSDMVTGITNGFTDQFPISQDLWKDNIEEYNRLFDEYYGEHSPSTLMYASGVDLILGLWNGMQAEFALLQAWWSSAITELETKMQELLDMGSPSKVMAKHGQNIMLGLAQGMRDTGYMPWLAMRSSPLFAFARTGGNSTTNNYVTNRNYNLGGVNTVRSSESVIRDFEIMRLME